MRWVQSNASQWKLANSLGIEVTLTIYPAHYVASINGDKWEIHNTLGNRSINVAKEMIMQSLEARLINATNDLDQLMY